MRASTAQGYPAKGINAWAKLKVSFIFIKPPVEDFERL